MPRRATSTGAVRRAGLESQARGRPWVLAAGIALLAFVVHSRVLGNGFIHGYDDNLYVLSNDHVREGLSWSGLVYAFTSECASNWHPLTMLSHMADCTLYGEWAAGHHLTSLILHAANAAVVFVVLNGLTGAPWKCALVAALFAVHPIHVESVAHVAQRKDLLSGLFWMLCIGAYARSAAQTGRRRYGWTALFMMLGLMSKPVVVTLPFVLLLLDVWPLRRIEIKGWRLEWSKARSLLLEKFPLFALSLVFSIITFAVQYASGAVQAIERQAVWERAANAVLAYVEYLAAAAWPARLAALYPHPLEYPVWKWGGALIVLATVTAFAVLSLHRRPYLAVGWFWFLGTLVPMIGIIQVGAQAMADRYAYTTFLGVYMAAVWGGADLAVRFQPPKAAISGAAVTVLLLLSGRTYVQIGYWKDAVTLWQRTVDVTENNVQGYLSLGMSLFNEHRYEEAEKWFGQAGEASPSNAGAHYYRGLSLLKLGRVEEAEREFRLVTGKNANFYTRVGDLFFDAGHRVKAMQIYHEGLALYPDAALLHVSYGIACEAEQNVAEAFRAYTEAKRLDPNIPNIDTLIARAKARMN